MRYCQGDEARQEKAFCSCAYNRIYYDLTDTPDPIQLENLKARVYEIEQKILLNEHVTMAEVDALCDQLDVLQERKGEISLEEKSRLSSDYHVKVASANLRAVDLHFFHIESSSNLCNMRYNYELAEKNVSTVNDKPFLEHYDHLLKTDQNEIVYWDLMREGRDKGCVTSGLFNIQQK